MVGSRVAAPPRLERPRTRRGAAVAASRNVRAQVAATQRLAEARARSIKRRLETQQRQADALLDYMTAQIATAKTADEEEERAMKRRGLLVSAHIPQAASQLDLARGKLGAGGRFSEALVTATDLIEENRRDLARRSGNYDAAGQKTRAAAILRTGEPGYLALTSTNKVRQTLALKRSRGPRGDKGEPELLQTLLQTSKSESAASLVSAAPAKTVVRKNADEAHADRVVLSRMDQKLKFLRNPSAAPRRKRSGGAFARRAARPALRPDEDRFRRRS